MIILGTERSRKNFRGIYDEFMFVRIWGGEFGSISASFDRSPMSLKKKPSTFRIFNSMKEGVPTIPMKLIGYLSRCRDFKF